MPEEPALGSEIDQLASAVAARFAASAGTARTAAASASLVDRLASAVGQRLAARTGTSIDLLASAVATRLAASVKVEPLVSGAATHFAGTPFASPDLEHVASRTAFQLRTHAEE